MGRLNDFQPAFIVTFSLKQQCVLFFHVTCPKSKPFFFVKTTDHTHFVFTLMDRITEPCASIYLSIYLQYISTIL